MPSTELQELVVADAEALRTWLLAHHATSPGVWLALTKKGGRRTTLTWQQAVDEALCVGWIDGQLRKRDDETSLIQVHPAWASQFVVEAQRRSRRATGEGGPDAARRPSRS